MPFCSKCGAEVLESVKFCSKCGNALQGKQITSETSTTALPANNTSRQTGQPENLSLWDYYIKCLKNYANFKGRARRREFWGFILFDIIISLLFTIVGGSLDSAILDIDFDDDGKGVFLVVFDMLYWLATFLPFLAVVVRRLHDVTSLGKSEYVIVLAINSLIVNIVQNFIVIDPEEIVTSKSQARWAIIISLWYIISMVKVIWYLCKDSYYTENMHGPCPKISAGNYG